MFQLSSVCFVYGNIVYRYYKETKLGSTQISLIPKHLHPMSSFSNLACPPYSISMLISVVSVQIRDEMEQGIFLMGFCRIRSFIQGMTEGSCFTIGYKFSYDLVYDSIVYIVS